MLEDFLENNPSTTAIGLQEPTHFSGIGVPYVIDIAITKDCTFPLEMYFLHELMHNSILLYFGEGKKENTPKEEAGYNLKG